MSNPLATIAVANYITTAVFASALKMEFVTWWRCTTHRKKTKYVTRHQRFINSLTA